MISGSKCWPPKLAVGRRAVALACAVLLAAVQVRAQSAAPDDEARSAARQMARDAIELMNAENYAAAEDLLRRAYDLVPAPTVAVLRGRALEELNRLVEAAESYELARRVPEDNATPAAFRDAKKEATKRLEALRRQIPLLTITVTGVEPDDERLEIRLDDRVVPPEMLGVRRPTDPGQHLILAAFEDTVHDTRWVTLQRGEHVKVLMRVDAPPTEAPPPPPPPVEPPRRRFGRREAGWLSLGVGAGGFVTGMVSGVWMLESKSELDYGCRPACPADLEQDLRAFRRSRTASAVGYGIGFTGLVVGGGLLLSVPGRCDASSRRLRVGDGRARLFASFGPGGVSVGGKLP